MYIKAGAAVFPRLLFASILLLVTACVGVPFDYPRISSTAMPVSNATPLGKVDLAWTQQHDEQTGIVGLADGIDALGARLRMMELSQRSIDAQYFIIKKDTAGALFTGKILRAADRGVRVRLLVDDIFSPGVDQAFSLLNSHPHVQVRLFNPLSRESLKYWSYLVDFSRANRRMHNKSFTVDNAITVVGGRNIGEEYFELDQDVAFDDFEVMAVGPVVSQVSAGFDQFWNSDLSVPMEAFELPVDTRDLDLWREFIQLEMDKQEQGPYGRAINSPLLSELRAGRLEPIPARATLVTDSPEKLQHAVGDAVHATLALETGKRLRAARHEVIIITPYFIPLARGSELIEQILAKGVRVVIITNSLASTNHVPVYSAYTRYRKRLLQAGAEFYEIRPHTNSGEDATGTRPEMSTLHSKVTIFDRETIFVGSLNFDPRSLLINSEMGLFIDSDTAVSQLVATVADNLARSTYRVELDERNRVRWSYQLDGRQRVLDKSPQTSWWRRFSAGFYGLLPLENQL